MLPMVDPKGYDCLKCSEDCSSSLTVKCYLETVHLPDGFFFLLSFTSKVRYKQNILLEKTSLPVKTTAMVLTPL